MISMDFTTTAISRPPIINKTYKSFKENLSGLDMDSCTLYINVDPIPAQANREEVIEVCSKYFGKVVANTPEKPNFTAAINWLFSSAKSEHIFNIEDDWKLTEKINVPDLLKKFEKHPQLYQIILRAYQYKYKACPLSPSILHERFYKKIGGNLDTSVNPEIQLRGEKFGLSMPTKDKPIDGKLLTYPKNKIILKDIGRGWITKQNFSKPDRKSNFITYKENS